MVTITIGANNYEAYADVATADVFLAADSRLNAIWTAADTDTKSRALVTSTRLIDRQDWKGTKTVDTQPLEWPRTGVVDRDGNALDPGVIPQEIIDGSIILAALIVEDPTLAEATSTGSNTKRVKAGSAEVEFFRPQVGTRFPIILHELFGDLLESSSFGSSSGSRSFGTDQESTIPNADSFGTDFTRSEGLP